MSPLGMEKATAFNHLVCNHYNIPLNNQCANRHINHQLYKVTFDATHGPGISAHI